MTMITVMQIGALTFMTLLPAANLMLPGCRAPCA